MGDQVLVSLRFILVPGAEHALTLTLKKLPVGRLVFRTRGVPGRETEATRSAARAVPVDGSHHTAELVGAAAIAGASAAAGIAILEHEVRAVRRHRARRDSSSSPRQIGAGLL